MKRLKNKCIKGNKIRPRVSIYISNKYIYAQCINDNIHHTIFSISSNIKEFKNIRVNTKIAYIIGENFGKKAILYNIKKIVLDKKNKKYHGKIKSFAMGARKYLNF